MLRRTSLLAGIVAVVVMMTVAGSGFGAAPNQVLVIAASADSYYSNPRFPTLAKYPTNGNVFEGLVRMTPRYGVRPGLATSWRLIPPNTWRFNIRRGVRFQDGQRLDANAVKYTFDQLAAAGATRAIGIDDKAVVNVVGPYTIDITPSFVNRRLIEQLVHPQRGIMAPGSTFDRPVGTGQFKFVSYERNRELVVERWDGYWGKKPKLARIVFKFIPDANARALALQSGSVDIAADIPRETTLQINAQPALRVARSRVGAYEALYFMIRGAQGYDLGKSPAIRAAVAFAVNRRVIVRNVWQGNAEIIQTMIPPAILGRYASLVTGFAFQPRRAERILERDGWRRGPDGIRTKGGRRLQLTMVVGFPNADIHGTMPEALQSMLRTIGIDVKIVRTPDSPSYSRVLQQGEGDIFVEVGNQNDANPCFLPDLLFYYKGKGHTDYGYRFGPGGRFDKRIDEECRTARTIEGAQRGAARAMRVLIDSNRIVVPIAGIYRIYGLSNRVRGFVPNPSQTNQGWVEVSMR